MRHGEVITTRIQTTPEYGSDDNLVGFTTVSISEQWCNNCKSPVHIRGVLDALRFRAEHDTKDCVLRGEGEG